jgi:hypothetical protein
MNLQNPDENPELQRIALRMNDLVGPEEERWHPLHEWFDWCDIPPLTQRRLVSPGSSRGIITEVIIAE